MDAGSLLRATPLRRLLLAAALSVAWLGASSAGAQEADADALPTLSELQAFVVHRAASEILLVKRAARQHYSDRGVWPRSTEALISAAYLPEDFSLVLRIGGSFLLNAKAEFLDVGLTLPKAGDLLDLAEQGQLFLPPPSALSAPPPELAKDGSEVPASDVPDFLGPARPGEDRFWDKIAKHVLVTRDFEYLRAKRNREEINRDPVGTLSVDGPEKEDVEAAIDFDKLALVLDAKGGTEFAVGVEVARIYGSADIKLGIDPSLRSALNGVLLDQISSIDDPDFVLRLSDVGRFAVLAADAVVLDAATIEEADIEVLNGSAPITRGQLESFAVTELIAGDNIILSVTPQFDVELSQAVGNVYIGVSRTPLFDELTATGRLSVGGALTVAADANIAQDLELGDRVNVEGDVRIDGMLSQVRGPHTLNTQEFVLEGNDYFVPEDARVTGDVTARRGVLSVGNRVVNALVIGSAGISLGNALSFRPNGETRRALGLIAANDFLTVNAGRSNLVVGSDANQTIFESLGVGDPFLAAGGGFRYSFLNAAGNEAMVLSDGRVGINLERDLSTYGVEPITGTTPTLVVEGVIAVTDLFLSTPGGSFGVLPVADIDLTNLIAGVASNTEDNPDVAIDIYPQSADPNAAFGVVFAIDDETLAYFNGSSGGLSIGNRINSGRLSVGSADADFFVVSDGGDIATTGTWTSMGSARLEPASPLSNARNVLRVDAVTDFLGSVALRDGATLAVYGDGVSGDVARFSGSAGSAESAVLRIIDGVYTDSGANPSQAPLRIERSDSGLFFAAGSPEPGGSAVGLARFENFASLASQGASLPFGTLAVESDSLRSYLVYPSNDGQPTISRLRVESADCPVGAAADDPRCSLGEFLIGGNAFTQPALLGTVNAYAMELIAGGATAVTIDTNQNLTISSDSSGRLSFRDSDAFIASPQNGQMSVSSAGSVMLHSSGTVQFGSTLARPPTFAVTLLAGAPATITGAVVFEELADPEDVALRVQGTTTFNGDTTIGSRGGFIELAGVVAGPAGLNGFRFCDPGTPAGCTVLRYDGAPDVSIFLSAESDGEFLVSVATASGTRTSVPGVIDTQGDVDFQDVEIRRATINILNMEPALSSVSAPAPIRVVREDPGLVFSANAADQGFDVYLVDSTSNFSSAFSPSRGALVVLQSSTDSSVHMYRPGPDALVRVTASRPVGSVSNNSTATRTGSLDIGTQDNFKLRLISAEVRAIDVYPDMVKVLIDASVDDFNGAGQSIVGEDARLTVDKDTTFDSDVIVEADGQIAFNGLITPPAGGALLSFSSDTSTATNVLRLTPSASIASSVEYTLGAFPFLSDQPIRLITGGDTDWVRADQLAPGAVTVDKLSLASGAVQRDQLLDNSIGTDDIAGLQADDFIDAAIDFRHISAELFRASISGQLIARHFAEGTLTNEDFLDGTLGPNDVQGTVSAFCSATDGGYCVNNEEDLAAAAITTNKIVDGSIVSRHIAQGAVTGAKILDGTITSADLATGAVSGLNLASGAVGAEQLADGAVGAEHISPAAMERVAQSVLSPGAVGAEQLADGAVGSGQLADGAVGAEQLADGAVGNDKLVAGTNYDRITRVGQLEELEVAGPIRARLDLASAAGATLCLSGAAISQCSSLAALKSAVRPLDLGLDTVLALRPRRFLWNADGREDFGFVAEEVTAVDPLLGSYAADGSLVGVRYRQMSALLARAVQEQQAELGPLSAALSANSAGHVGVGKAPHTDYRLDVAGSVRAGVYVETSDRRLKRDLRPLSGAAALAALSGIDGMRYRWNEAYRRMRPGAEGGWQAGVIAQQVAGRLPDLVRQGSDGYLAVSYDRFVPYLIEAVNELSARAEGMRAALAPAPGGLRLRRPLLGADGRAVVSPAGDIHARSLSVAGDMAVGDRFSLRRSSTLASLLRLDVERRGDDTVEGYLSARDVYLADRGKWWSELDSSVKLVERPPLSWECDSDAAQGLMRLVTSSSDLYVCGGIAGWWVQPMRQPVETAYNARLL